jgi:hypothetical protein
MKIAGNRWLLLLSFCFFSRVGYPQDCSSLPTHFKGNEFPTGTFISNFDNSCYTIPFNTSPGGTGIPGDLNSLYNKMYYKLDPHYQLVILGTFPNTRYFSITVDDDHGAVSQTLLDENIVPLTSEFVNPYQTGVSYVAGQRYGAIIDFGGAPGSQESGCLMPGYNIAQNTLDATQRHQGMNWNADPGVFQALPAIPLHVVDTPQHSNPNTAGVLNIRNYIDITPKSPSKGPQVIVRDVASGCAYPAWYVMQSLQVVSTDKDTGRTWLDGKQTQAHNEYDNDYLPRLCFAADPHSAMTWERGGQFVSGGNPDSSYIRAFVPAGLPAGLASAGEVMRMRFRLPTTPPTPCTNGCSRSGKEQMRYMSLSFQDNGGITLASLADSAFTKDPAGYVTLVVGTGAKIPSWITPANGYTYLDLAAIANYSNLNNLQIREILPMGAFNCAGQYVPYNANVYSSSGGLMGEYLPVVDYPASASLPRITTPLVGKDACADFPRGEPDVSPKCGDGSFPPISISAVTSQCAAPGCSGIVLQAHPPIIVIGNGFGAFPAGLPYSGNSSYVEIADTNQGWNTGTSGSACTVTIDNWAGNMISLVANVNQNGECPVAAGDQITISVRNPQTNDLATTAVTAAQP